MSVKIDSLLKKATTFERLALYGDRKVFLQSLAQEAVDEAAPWSIYDEPSDPRGDQKNWVPQVVDGRKKYVYMGPNARPEHTPGIWEKYFEPREPSGLPNVIAPPASSDEGAPTEPMLFQHPMSGRAVPEQEKAAPKASVPYASQLVNTLNTFSGRAAGMNDAQKAALLKQLNNTTLAELARIVNQLGGYGNPYASPQEQALAQQIRSAVGAFGKAFSTQINNAPNYARLA